MTIFIATVTVLAALMLFSGKEQPPELVGRTPRAESARSYPRKSRWCSTAFFAALFEPIRPG
jgi:hypothetical protein